MGKLNREEIDELLGRPLVSVVSTVRPDGTPHMTPVWHLVDGDDVVLTVDNSSVKARNVRTNPVAALTVVTDETPQRWLLVSGKAELSTERLEEIARKVSVHYMGEEEGIPYSKQAMKDFDFVLLRIKPTRVVGFDGEEE